MLLTLLVSVSETSSQWLSDEFGYQDQIQLTPDGRTLYLRDGSDLAVLTNSDTGFNIREVIDLSLNDEKTRGENL